MQGAVDSWAEYGEFTASITRPPLHATLARFVPAKFLRVSEFPLDRLPRIRADTLVTKLDRVRRIFDQLPEGFRSDFILGEKVKKVFEIVGERIPLAQHGEVRLEHFLRGLLHVKP